MNYLRMIGESKLNLYLTLLEFVLYCRAALEAELLELVGVDKFDIGDWLKIWDYL